MIYIGSDHRGIHLKEKIKTYLSDEGKAYSDLGTKNEEAVDFPDIGFRVAEKVRDSIASGGSDRAILICGSGVGMAIVANKVRGVRAVLATSVEIARAARTDDDINVLVLGADLEYVDSIEHIIDAFLQTEFDAVERRVRRVQKITDYENSSL